MSQTLSDDDMTAVQAVIANSSLEHVDFHELSARRIPGAKGSSVETEDEGNLSLAVQQRIDDQSFGVRLNATATFSGGEATVSVAAEYQLLNEIKPTRRALQIFCNEVAIMTVFPYLREGMSSITTRVFGEAIYLPVAERGSISIDVEPLENALA